ncbi:hypothetical protein EPUS_04337 [Endocarpon pusillum Z07020]|uniref:Clr5 domain-containing protein n=1 Tax=Endocarpon pusillum (strain Z07020 / HMAS-L-300199) TaxID=1263415 RepID=U1HZC5_ENDPU|nr:uncharacterized protein EPUS_04337 [Endocarpon pusillum Z07020]ERF76260.1 hypothetical protein EPUS_04337 [Endocarpon pusillum Z07020]
MPTAGIGMESRYRVLVPMTIDNTGTTSAASTNMEFACDSHHPCDSCMASREALEVATNVHNAIHQIKLNCECLRINQAFLKNAIQRYSNAIIARWKKRSQTKRAEILEKAFPGMPQKKFSIIQARYAEENLEASSLCCTFLLPYLSVEDLSSDPMRLLSLLYVRTEYDASTWAGFDLENTKADWHEGLLDSVCKSAMIAYGARYGEIVEWDQERVDQGHLIALPRANLLIQIQATLSAMLAETVGILTDGATIEERPTKWLALIESGFRRSREDEIYSSFIDRAFQRPPVFDIDELLKIAEARTANAQDQLWLLQTEPSHVHREYRLLQDSEYFSVVVPQLSGTVDVEKYNLIGNILSVESTGRFSEWNCVVEECKHVREQLNGCGGQVQLGKPLPEKYSQAVSCLEAALESILWRWTRDVASLLPKLRGFASCYDHVLLDIQRAMTRTTAKRLPDYDCYKEDPLFWCLYLIVYHDDSLESSFEPPFVFAFLGDLVGNDTRVDKNRLDQRLMDGLADIGAIWEMIMAIRYHRPSRYRMETLQALDLGSARAGCRRLALETRRLRGTQVFPNQMSLSVKPPLQLFVESFRPGDGTKENDRHERRMASRRLLKSFWDAARDFQRQYLGGIGLSTEEIQMHLASISFDLAPEYLESLEKRNQKIPSPVHVARSLTGSEASQCTSWDVSQEQSSRFVNVGPVKSKMKRRPTPREDDVEAPLPEAGPAANEDVHDHESDSTDSRIENILLVTPESFKIFMDMFPSKDLDSQTAKKGLTDWKKFVGAMTDAGFVANHNSGSAVTFIRQSGGRIIFHKPHPVAKLDRHVLLGYGKRPRRWFGLDQESFQVAPRAGT